MKFWTLSLSILCASTVARADDPPAPVGALLANPGQLATWLAGRDSQVEAAGARVEAAAAQGDQARVIPNPQLQVGMAGFSLGRGNRDTTGALGPTSLTSTTNITVGGTETVEIGKRAPRRAAADLRLREAGEGAVGTLGGRINDATTALGKLTYVVAHRAAVQTNLDAARKLQALEKTRVDNKDLSSLDFSRIELDTLKLEDELRLADADVAGAVASCSAALYAPCGTDQLDAAALDAGAPLPDTIPDAGRAIAQRPAHVAEELEGQALGKDAELAEHRRIPDPTFGIEYTYDNYEYSGSLPQTLGFSVAIPLPFFDQGTHDARAARANAHAVEATDRAEIRQETAQAEALRAQLSSLQGTLHHLETEVLPRSTKIVGQTQKAFDLGEARLPDLLLAERDHRELLNQVLDTHFNLFNVRVQLRQALGLDDEAARAARPRK